jgi:hypothetical protein
MPRRALTAGSWTAALLLLALPAAAETIAFVAPEGGCTLRRAPAGTHAATIAALSAEADALEAMTERLAGEAAAMRFAPAREHVPQFGDWAYGWAQSYVTSYRILARGAVEIARATAAEGEPRMPRLAEEMSEPIRAEFRRTVLAPVSADGGLGAELLHVGNLVDAAWAGALAGATRRLSALPIALPGERAQRIDLLAAGAPLAPALAATLPDDPVALLVDEGADTGTVFLRSMRPMAARLGAVVVRVSEAGSIVATGGAFGYALGGLPGTVAGVAGGIGLSWGIDWLFNRVDSALNKTTFEAQALEAITRAERRVADTAAEAARVGLRARMLALGGAEGCP